MSAVTDYSALVNRFLAQPQEVRRALDRVTTIDFDVVPADGSWTIRQIVCHLADAELLYVDRMRRILAEDDPPLVPVDPARYLAALAVRHRDLQVELRLIESLRAHLGTILRSLGAEQFARRGVHSTLGTMSLAEVLARAAEHIPHHLAFLERKAATCAAQRAGR